MSTDADNPAATLASTTPMDAAVLEEDSAALAQTAPLEDLATSDTLLASDTPAAPATPPISPSGLMPGVRLHDQFEVRARLGEGGMGAVWLAHDTSLDRDVAVKVLSADLAGSEELKERFIREARAQAKLNHPNVVPIYFIGDQDGLLFFVMERVRGEALADMLERGERLPWEQALEDMIEVASALRQAHSRGIIHRDIKPGNLLRDEEGHVKVADFGLAKPIGGEGEGKSLTGKGVFLGTPLYMAPEQARAEDVDHRADMYALGATFHHLITGAPLYDAKTPLAVVMKHATEPIPDAQALVPAIPNAARDILTQLLAKSPEERFADYDELIAALELARPRARTPAGFAPRMMATVADVIALSVATGLLAAVLPHDADDFALLLLPVYIAGSMWRSGRTLGMWLFNLEVIDERGERPGLRQLALRVLSQLWALVLIILFGLVIYIYEGGPVRAEATSWDAIAEASPLMPAFVIMVLITLPLNLLGALMAILHPRKLALHDITSKTRIVFKA